MKRGRERERERNRERGGGTERDKERELGLRRWILTLLLPFHCFHSVHPLIPL